MKTFRKFLVVPMIALALTIGFTLSGAGRSQTITTQAQSKAFTGSYEANLVVLDVNKLAIAIQILQKFESRQAFTVVSNGKTVKWEAAPGSLAPIPGDARAQETARIRAIRRVVQALSVDDPFILSVDASGAACACVCSSATGNKWSCDPSGCSSKDGTGC